MATTKLMPLAEAVRTYVRPGMHLNFAATPGRSNAAVREVARSFQGTSPGFVLSSTGFHSLAHLLGLLRLGKRYIACFFGDNYPRPRPNALYTQLLQEGAAIEHWSLWAYVTALRAGALGHPYGLTNSLAGTTLGAELAAAGRFFQLPDPQMPQRMLGLVAALRPDITFVHAPLGDSHGNLAFSAPYAEGFWGALGATVGVIATVERIVTPEELAALQEAIKIPARRVLAVCVEPFGAHPQPLYTAPALGVPGYRDDFAHYTLWRAMTHDAALFERFADAVLRAEDGAAGYRAFVGAERLASLTVQQPPTRRALSSAARRPGEEPDRLRPSDAAIIRAARTIVARVRAQGYRSVLAGIGQSFFAARLARLWLAEEGIEVAVMVETGLYDLDCGPAAGGFLLGYDTIARARRLSAVEDVLGALTCGADNACLGVIGAAQVDPRGNVNTTRLSDGRLLVGSGGANDIASAAAEVVVVTTCDRAHLVPQVDYITSPGRGVLHVVTDLCTLRRATAAESTWTVCDIGSAEAQSATAVLDQIRANCAWELIAPAQPALMPPITAHELRLLRSLDPEGIYW